MQIKLVVVVVVRVEFNEENGSFVKSSHCNSLVVPKQTGIENQ
jgi:hypothetical protein